MFCSASRGGGREVAADSRTERVLRPVRGAGKSELHGRPGRRRSRLAGDGTEIPPGREPKSSALQPLPPHSPALGFLFRCLSVTGVYGDRIRPLAPDALSMVAVQRTVLTLWLLTLSGGESPLHQRCFQFSPTPFALKKDALPFSEHASTKPTAQHSCTRNGSLLKFQNGALLGKQASDVGHVTGKNRPGLAWNSLCNL